MTSVAHVLFCLRWVTLLEPRPRFPLPSPLEDILSQGTLSLLASALAWLMVTRSVVLGDRGQRCLPLVATSSACPSRTTSTRTRSECFRLKVWASAGAALWGERRAGPGAGRIPGQVGRGVSKKDSWGRGAGLQRTPGRARSGGPPRTQLHHSHPRSGEGTG